MLRFFYNLSIKHKLNAIILATSAAVLLLSASILVTNEVFSVKRNLSSDLLTLADVMGINASVGLIFFNPQAAEENLASLKAKPNIVTAHIFDMEGEIFASYHRENINPVATPERTHSRDFYADYNPDALTNSEEVYFFHENHIDVFKHITREGEILGTVYILSDLEELWRRLYWYGGVLAVVIFASLILVLMLASKLQRIITTPIYDLLKITTTVSKQKDYTLRAKKLATDEVGRLIDGFNEMLVNIENRDQEIHFLNKQLDAENQRMTLDLSAVMKTSQAISGEIVLHQLIKKFMHVVIENVGAEEGWLILRNAAEKERQSGTLADFSIEAHGTVAEMQILDSISLDLLNPDEETLSKAVLAHTVKMQESLVLNDAAHSELFANDPYLSQRQSVLCFPIIYKNQLTGLFYLENNLTTGAFTEDRLAVLEMLSTQIAISLENAQMMATLEAKVVERTAQLNAKVEELTKTRQELVQSEKMAALGGLVAGVAHEINTPLGIGITAASTLENKTGAIVTAYDNKQLKGSALKAYFDTAIRCSHLILNNLERAGELVQNFKQVAVDQTHLDKRTFAVKKYIKDSLINLTPYLKKTPHQITVNGDDTLSVDSYPGAFSQIVTNLVMNSLNHAYQKGEAGHLQFDLRRESERLILTYSDDGCGIPADNLGKIFEPFFTTKRAQGGTGLGLHIVYNLVVQKLQGAIRVESGVGVGTTFIIDLPLNNYKNLI